MNPRTFTPLAVALLWTAACDAPSDRSFDPSPNQGVVTPDHDPVDEAELSSSWS